MIVRTHTDSVNNGIGCDDSCLVIFVCDSYTILGDGNNLSAGNSCDADLMKENLRLRKELEEARKENLFLKKAAAFFAKEIG